MSLKVEGYPHAHADISGYKLNFRVREGFSAHQGSPGAGRTAPGISSRLYEWSYDL